VLEKPNAAVFFGYDSPKSNYRVMNAHHFSQIVHCSWRIFPVVQHARVSSNRAIQKTPLLLYQCAGFIAPSSFDHCGLPEKQSPSQSTSRTQRSAFGSDNCGKRETYQFQQWSAEPMKRKVSWEFSRILNDQSQASPPDYKTLTDASRSCARPNQVQTHSTTGRLSPILSKSVPAA